MLLMNIDKKNSEADLIAHAREKSGDRYVLP